MKQGCFFSGCQTTIGSISRRRSRLSDICGCGLGVGLVIFSTLRIGMITRLTSLNRSIPNCCKPVTYFQLGRQASNVEFTKFQESKISGEGMWVPLKRCLNLSTRSVLSFLLVFVCIHF
eukprot:Lithocolla_globosa_v1_NODE_1388_length_2614_cov_3.997655.p2 type:complete len:119 gc:universal NODE_1388_length_2614_cov_3.997655:1129-773(-)